MHLVSQSDIDSTMTGGHRFVINLKVQDDGLAVVRSCEVLGTHHRNRFTFPSKVTVDEVFIGEIAAGINQCMSALSNTTEVVSLPSVAIEVPGLSLARAQLITTKGEDGRLGIILRFKMLLGGIGRAFRPELGIEDSVADHSKHMSALVLTDIVLPLLNLCTAAENGSLTNSEALDDFMDTLIDRSQDVRFQAELIKRFVTSADTSKPVQDKAQGARPRIELVSRR